MKSTRRGAGGISLHHDSFSSGLSCVGGVLQTQSSSAFPGARDGCGRARGLGWEKGDLTQEPRAGAPDPAPLPCPWPKPSELCCQRLLLPLECFRAVEQGLTIDLNAPRAAKGKGRPCPQREQPLSITTASTRAPALALGLPGCLSPATLAITSPPSCASAVTYLHLHCVPAWLLTTAIYFPLLLRCDCSSLLFQSG